MEKEKKKDLKFILISTLIISMSLLYLFQTSYAKYKKQLNGNVLSNIASWNIKVNNETIKNKMSLEKDIIPVFNKNDYIKENVLAPGSTGYFDLTIDAENVDVDFIYEITEEKTSDSLIDLKITSYELNDSGTKIPYDETTPLTGELLKNTKDTKIRLYFGWDDNEETQVMNNVEDTNYAQKPNVKGNLKLKLHFIQKKAQ
ncbi:MAG: hypothetical protein HFE81_02995 [Bacilli bacterium]|nr:hypothetical protein [Bacilli bacterium]